MPEWNCRLRDGPATGVRGRGPAAVAPPDRKRSASYSDFHCAVAGKRNRDRVDLERSAATQALAPERSLRHMPAGLPRSLKRSKSRVPTSITARLLVRLPIRLKS